MTKNSTPGMTRLGLLVLEADQAIGGSAMISHTTKKEERVGSGKHSVVLSNRPL